MKKTRQQYQYAAITELQKLNELLVEEASLKEKEAALAEDELSKIKEEIQLVKEQLKGGRKAIELEKKEMRQTVEEVDKAVDRGEIKRIHREEETWLCSSNTGRSCTPHNSS